MLFKNKHSKTKKLNQNESLPQFIKIDLGKDEGKI